MRIPQTRSEDLPPMRVNTVTMFVVGTIVWIIALVVVLILQARGAELAGAVRICLAGIGFGVLAIAWAIPQHRRSLRAERVAQAERAAGAEGGTQTTTAADPTATRES